MRKLFIYLLFTISYIASATPENLHFVKYNVETGLSQNTVWCLMQDSQGFIWLGTKDGLNRFDGLGFKIFKTNLSDTSSIGNNFIRSLFEDKEKNIWVGTDKGLYIYNPTLDRFTKFRLKTESNLSIEKAVNSIIADKQGNIWIGVFGQGLFKYVPKSKKLYAFLHNEKDPQSLSSELVWTILSDSRGTLWVGTLVGGLNKFIPSTGKFKRYWKDGKPGSISDNDIYSLYEDSQHHFWVGSWQSGLILMNRDKEVFTPFKSNGTSHSLSHNAIRNIMEYKPGYLFIGTDKGLNIYNIRKNTAEQYYKETLNPRSISDNAIYSFLKDVEGNFWIGTYFGGVNYLVNNLKPIEHYFPSGKPGSLRGNAISQMIEDPTGNIWIGTEDEGLNVFDINTKRFTNYSLNTPGIKLSYHNLHALLYDNNEIWVGTFGTGLNVINLSTKKVRSYRKSLSDINSLSDDGVFSIYKDKSDNIWVGTIIGLNVFNRKKNNFTRINALDLASTYIYDIIDDNKGNVWFASYEKGLYRYNIKSGKWKNYRNNPSNRSSLSYDKVISLWCDSKDRIWIGTEGGGLCRYLYKTDDFITYDKKEGLPNNVIYSIKDDNKGNLWFTTNNGLVRFNPDNKKIKVFKKSDGLQSDQFNYKSGLKTRDGQLYFGGINGFNSFYPDSFKFNKIIPPVVFTDFQLFNKEVGIRVKGSPLKQAIRFTHQITLSHDQSTLSFEFVALSYIAPYNNIYAYKLENFDPQWNYIGNENKISYTSLPPGEYTFRVKASNNDGIWNEAGAAIHIKVLPPWWKSTFALFSYITILIISIVAFERYLIKISEDKHRHKIRRLKEEKEREMSQMKIDFFTNIAHEIRTPLTLISGPLQRLITSNNGSNEVKEEYSLMHKNVNRLLLLVNQLLDFRKIEQDHYRLNLSYTNLIELLQSVYECFIPLAHQNSINFKFNYNQEHFIFNVDNEAITKIVSNLLSNAFKFAKTEIELSFDFVQNESEDSFLEIRVKDDGNGIPSEKLDKIFLPFYQVGDSEKVKVPMGGTGLGLAFARSLVELHKGSLFANSELGKGSEFIMRIPVDSTTQNPIPENQETSVLDYNIVAGYVDNNLDTPIATESTDHTQHLPEIIIVEDNGDLCNFLKSSLQKEYAVTVAPNGSVAYKLIGERSFDLIISDIMMPEMDGIELCTKIKNDLRTSHIPVILLTAKANISSKIEGLEHGADAYVEKPFVLEHLKAQIFNLLENRARLKVTFARQPFVDTAIISHSKTDEHFMEKTREIIYKHIDDFDFSIDEFATLLNMSRSGLHKKVKALSGYSPIDFIRVIRLKRAAEMLASGEYRINEVCYAVGFNTPSYFAKCFQQQFGILPKDFNLKTEITISNIT